MSITQLVVGYLCGIVITSMFIWVGVALHMAYTKMDMMLEHLKNCAAIMVRAPLRHGGPWGKLMLVGGISGIVTFPGFYLKRGELSLDDLQSLPSPIKRKLAILQWSVWGLLIAMALLVAIGESGLLY
ncbi:MAG TPA: hypothetical protein DIW52_05045 [Pseudomonas sp.]|jgi:hypothetical protein|nr:hypothetical protein [Pseudomonas sp.]